MQSSDTKENISSKTWNKGKAAQTDAEYVFKYEQNRIFKQKSDALNLNREEPLSEEALKELELYKEKIKNAKMDIFEFDEDEDGTQEQQPQNQQGLSQKQETRSEPKGLEAMELVQLDQDSENEQEAQTTQPKAEGMRALSAFRDQRKSGQLRSDDEQQSEQVKGKDSLNVEFDFQPVSPHSLMSMSSMSPNETLDGANLQESACVFLKKKADQIQMEKLSRQQEQEPHLQMVDSSHPNPFLLEEEEEIEEELKGIRIHNMALEENVNVEIVDKQLFVSSKVPPGIIIKCKLKRSSGLFNLMSPEFELYLENGLKHLLSVKKNAFRNRQLFLFSTKIGNFSAPLRTLMANVLHNCYWLVQEPKLIENRKIANLDVMVQYGPVVEKANVDRDMTALIPPSLKSTNIGIQYQSPEIDFPWFQKNIPLKLFNLSQDQGMKKSSPKNFSLVDQEDEDYVYLKMEKESNDIFDVEIQHPLTPLQAIAIIMTRFDAQLN